MQDLCIILSGVNPTTVNYNASAVKMYNAASSLVRYEIKNIFFYSEIRSSLLQNTGVVVVNSKVVGLAPGVNLTTVCRVNTQ
jgi:hypothetical protein